MSFTHTSIRVDSDITLAEFMASCYDGSLRVYEVFHDGRQVGEIRVDDVERMPSGRWRSMRVADLTRPGR